MMLYYSPGMAMRRDFGKGTCPHCEAEFTKANKHQVTCAAPKCRAKQDRKAWSNRQARKKALRLEAARLLESAGAA